MKNSVFGFFLGLILAGNVNGQTSALTSVTVTASDPIATEPGAANLPDTGTFTITRFGPTNLPLMVFFTLGGTASNSVDYLKIESPVTIHEGSRIARVGVVPLADDLVEGDERVILRIVASPLAQPGAQYILPTNSLGAVVTIRDYPSEPTNSLPMVHISRPPAGAIFHAPADIDIAAETVDPDGWVGHVEFFANGAKIGESILNFIVAPPDGTPITHEFQWKGVGPGEYSLTARATDDQGAARMSFPVRIFVSGTNAPPPQAVVSIVATDPEGSEIPEVPPDMDRPQLIDPAIFMVSRAGAVSNDLAVYYIVSGTASNGVDYVEIPRELKIPAGSRSAEIEINVIDDLLAEGPETVRIRIVPPPCIEIYPPPPECYLVGIPGVAEARILDNDVTTSNRPPVVSIVVPTNGAVFFAPADIQIIAHAFDSDGYVHTVEFFAGTNSIGITTNNPFAANIMNPFQIKWADVPPGGYVLTALATDDRGAQSRSRPVYISVIGDGKQTVVNIRAVDPEAAEQDPRLDSLPNNALLRVTRSGPTDFDLPVYYHVGGTASNGVDYVRLTGRVLIPQGSEFADIVIEAIDDKLVERTESVHVALVPPACIAIYPPPPECYLVGSASRAIAFILDDEPFETNLPPHVEITRPIGGATFRAPADIHIVARTVDRDGYVGKVEFFANSHKIGEASKQFLVPPPDGEPIEYDFEWKGVEPGAYALTARAIDDNGAPGYSLPVRISVVGTNAPPPTNVAVVTVETIDAHASEGPIIWTTNRLGTVEPYGVSGLADSNIIIRPYTNVAIFEVRRAGGNPDLPLRVFYETHGTASEGVDYLDLPASVEIPAGHRAARVVIWPIDDRLTETLESVVLCLRPSPLLSILPDYVIGRPGHAGAVIADNDTPRLPYVCLSDGVFHWCRPATDGQCFRIECSTDLKEWTLIGTVTAIEGAVQYVDPDGQAHDRRFYRAIPVPCPVQ